MALTGLCSTSTTAGGKPRSSFKAAPDFETAADADYEQHVHGHGIEVMYEDGEGNVDSDSMNVTITVTNVEEDGAITLNAVAAQRWHGNNRNPGRR